MSASNSRPVDLDEVGHLVDQLERDLAKARAGGASVDTLRAEVEQLRVALSDQRDTLREYLAAGPVGVSALAVSREDLRRISAFGGLAPVTGEGITLQVEGALDAIALNDLLNELRNAGAEALAVDQIRITHRSVAVQGPTSLLVDGMAGALCRCMTYYRVQAAVKRAAGAMREGRRA